MNPNNDESGDGEASGSRVGRRGGRAGRTYPRKQVVHPVFLTERTSTSPPSDGSPEPDYTHPAVGKGRIFSSASRRGLRRGTPARTTVTSTGASGQFDTEGTAGTEICLLTNYFKVTKNPEWALFQYGVEFDPDEDDKFARKCCLRSQRKLIGPYIFDGTTLFTPKRLLAEGALTGDADIMALTVTRSDETSTRLQFKYQGVTDLANPVYLQFFNLIVRKCLFGMGLEEMGRNFYDSNMAIDFPALKIQLWPGYVTSLDHYEEDTLLCVEVTHKVIRTESLLSVIAGIMKSGRHRDVQGAVLNVLKESIVMTAYNKRTYRVRDVDFQSTPQSSFATKTGAMVTYKDYYQTRYQLDIGDLEQPLIIAKQTQYDPRQRGDDEGLVTLIPELCQFTGLTEQIKANFTIMKELAKNLHMSPAKRVEAVMGFMTRFQGCHSLVEELADWGFVFQSELLRTEGRVLPKERIKFQNGSELPNDQADWTIGFRNHRLLAATPMNKWVIIVTKRDAGDINNLVRTMQKVSDPLGFVISPPSEVITMFDNKIQTYVRTIDQLIHNKTKSDGLQMVFVVLSTSSTECYAAVKKRLVVDHGIPSQCFLAKNLKARGLMSIATKMCVQMCTKLGGEPWEVNFPLEDLMVIGFETYGKKLPQISCMVASLTPTFTKYYSTTSFSSTSAEKGKNILTDLTKCALSYKTHNDKLPTWILIYRTGLADDDVQPKEETKVIEEAIEKLYITEDVDSPKFTYVITSKRINTRLFAEHGDQVKNVPPGTILDHTITKRDRYDFFLVSATGRQGTVSPCAYNVIRDTSGTETDMLQALTYKLCHLYFNWSGTVAIPAPCQYAHKLAALTAVAYERSAHPNLSELLYYL